MPKPNDKEKVASDQNKGEQCNPNNPMYQGHEKGYKGTGDQADLKNRGEQMNPNNKEYGGGGGKKEQQSGK